MSLTVPLFVVVTVLVPFGTVPAAVPCALPKPVSAPPLSVSLQRTLRSALAAQSAPIDALVVGTRADPDSQDSRMLLLIVG